MSDERFDKDIELLKLQAKISGAQAWYYAVTAGALAVLSGLLITSLTVSLPTVIGYVVNVLQLSMLILIALARRTASNTRIQLRQNFEDLYNQRRIEY